VIGWKTIGLDRDLASLSLEGFQLTRSRHHHLLPGQDKLARSRPMSGESWFVVSCGLRLSEVVLGVIRKPQVSRSIRDTHTLCRPSSFDSQRHLDGRGCKIIVKVVRRLHPFNKLEKPRQIEPLHVPNDCPGQGNGLHHRVGGQGRVHCESNAQCPTHTDSIGQGDAFAIRMWFDVEEDL